MGKGDKVGTSMRLGKTVRFVEDYLYSARGHRVLEQSMFAEGERRGSSEGKLRRAGARLEVSITGGVWELPAWRCDALDAMSLRSLSETSLLGPAVAMANAVVDTATAVVDTATAVVDSAAAVLDGPFDAA